MHLRLNRKSPLPIHIQLKAQLAHLIQAGEWSPGRRLPTVRQLAGSLRINRNTASRVFADLAREGHLSCERGRGTFVSPRRAGGRPADDEAETRSTATGYGAPGGGTAQGHLARRAQVEGSPVGLPHVRTVHPALDRLAVPDAVPQEPAERSLWRRPAERALRSAPR